MLFPSSESWCSFPKHINLNLGTQGPADVASAHLHDLFPLTLCLCPTPDSLLHPIQDPCTSFSLYSIRPLTPHSTYSQLFFITQGWVYMLPPKRGLSWLSSIACSPPIFLLSSLGWFSFIARQILVNFCMSFFFSNSPTWLPAMPEQGPYLSGLSFYPQHLPQNLMNSRWSINSR